MALLPRENSEILGKNQQELLEVMSKSFKVLTQKISMLFSSQEATESLRTVVIMLKTRKQWLYSQILSQK